MKLLTNGSFGSVKNFEKGLARIKR